MKLERVYKVYISLGMVLIIELVYLFMNSAIVQGVNKRADNMKAYATAMQEDKNIVPGDIYDRNGETIVLMCDDKTAVYKDGMAYSQLIGYTGKRVYSPMAETVEEVVGSRNDARLMAFLDESYWKKNGIYKTINLDGIKGQSAVLTIDSSLQETVYQLLAKEMNPSKDIGSAIVLDVKTGEILADVCFPTYDFNDLKTAQLKMNTDEKETNLEPGYPITYKKSIAPGSIFKMLMAVSLIDHGLKDYKVKNDSFVVNDSWKCKNMYYKSKNISIDSGDELDLETALNISSNAYFAKAALELGAERMNETAEKFMLKSGQNFQLFDFGNAKYNWNLNVSEDILAQTGFGQGLTEWSTIYAAMITQAIANDGCMLKPYLVKKLIDEKGKEVYKSNVVIMSSATSKKTARLVTKYLESTAKECSSMHHLDATEKIFKKYRVAGKTGTAENGDKEKTNNAWYVSFAPADNPQYVVVVNQAKTKKAGYRMMPVVADIYSYLFEND